MKRCKYCKRKKATEVYEPYCSFHCKEWGKLVETRKYLRTLGEEKRAKD